MSASMQITGLRELQSKLKTLPERVQRKVMRPAVSAAATPVVKAAKSNAPKQSGTLKKSIGKKVTTNTKTQSVSAIIGPRKGVSGDFNGKLRKPSRYAHLVEKGFIDKHGVHHPPHPFLNPALAETSGQSVSILAEQLGTGIEKEAAKLS